MDGDGNTRNGTFVDSEHDLDTMRRYELFLQLQAEADELTDEEYIARLDEISGGDWSDLIKGSEAYGDTEETAAMAAARREAEEMPPGEHVDGAAMAMPDPQLQDDMPYGDGSYGSVHEEHQDAASDETYSTWPDLDDAVSEQEFDGVDAETVAGQDGIDPESEGAAPETGPDGPTDTYGTEDGLDEGRSEDADEHVQPDMAEQHDAFQYGAIASSTTGISSPEQEEHADEPETSAAFDGTAAVPQLDNSPTIVPAIDEKEDVPEGRFIEHSEFQVHDVFDDIAVGSGLAGAVVSYEYVQPESEKASPSPTEPGKTPALAAVYREIERMDGPSRNEPSVDGPSGP